MSRSTPADRGATAITVAISMVLLMGMAAIAIDLGLGFNERRQDQTAADLGVMAGALEIPLGVSGGGVTDDDMVASALDYVRQNLPIQYSDSEWQTLWEGCVDPASERNSEPGDNFVAMSLPSGWVATDALNWCISIDAAKSLFRVRTPDQIVPASFARVIGFDSLQTHAAAVANILPAGAGILPFGFPESAADGAQHCLSAGPTGLSDDPCAGPNSGNFGTLKVKLFIPSSPYNGCNPAPVNSVLALNIAAGVDHPIVPLKNHADLSKEVKDVCYNSNVNTLQSDPGFPIGTEWGLATGSGLPSGKALLQQGPGMKLDVVGNPLDNVPLWDWLLSGPDYGGAGTPSVSSDDAPLFCDPDGFENGVFDFDGDGFNDPQFDFDGDGMVDPRASWQHMQRCLTDYALGGAGAYTVIFSSDLGDRDENWSPRFTYVPQFWDTSLGPGISEWLHLWRYRAIFVQGTWWRTGGTFVVHHPGEPCIPCSGNNARLKQVSAFIIPDAALPADLRGDPPGGGFINPFTVLLYR